MFRMIIIDTASIHHSLRAIGKKLDYINFILYLKNLYETDKVVVFVDKNASVFVKYLNKIPDITVIQKEAYKKKITSTQKIWYLSFAVDIALSMYIQREKIIIVSTDIEILPILNQNIKVDLYGIGTPRILREHSQYCDIPSQYLLNNIKEKRNE